MKQPDVHRRAGLGVAEVVVIVVILGFIVLMVLMGLTRARETARMASCRENLRKIGVAMSLYDQAVGSLPEVPELKVEKSDPAIGPIGLMLEQLGLTDFSPLVDPTAPPPKGPGADLRERVVPGFLCPADPNATALIFSAPISYRATTGDTTNGQNGPFAIGKRVSLAKIADGDGTAYTAGFSERLVGNDRPADPRANNYAIVASPVRAEGCGETPKPSWRGDAGSSWLGTDWDSTLYNHSMVPGATPSCIAEDGQTARMGAGSGHVSGVNLLMLDGAVRTYSSTVDARLWQGLSSYQDLETAVVEQPQIRDSKANSPLPSATKEAEESEVP